LNPDDQSTEVITEVREGQSSDYIFSKIGNSIIFSNATQESGNELYKISYGTSNTSWNAINTTIGISPNPVKDILNLDFNSSQLLEPTYQVLDVTGKEVLSGKLDKYIVVNDLKSGLYFLTIRDSDIQVATSKFIKQ